LPSQPALAETVRHSCLSPAIDGSPHCRRLPAALADRQATQKKLPSHFPLRFFIRSRTPDIPASSVNSMPSAANALLNAC
jgi:hypothetical protein